jgi:DNA-binding HxlR family transcriptional regulator
MLNREYADQNCSVASALEIVGERWTLLIVRDALLGLTRFGEFLESLGIARNVLTDRLNCLVDAGIFETVPGTRSDRVEYRLTLKGRELLVPLTALRQWGDKYLSDKPPTLARRRSDKKPVIAALVAKGGDVVGIEDVELVAGPGRDSSRSATWRLLERRAR